ncbi:MAG: hypothetical protein CVU44_04110 [Chloroflexi bacterium HGW-Chloroflexi-6]|nr:MAG: hypothetical protein CVU44_04110 [Chloroflexi bacterium HGW-Chloroflexi-6]
MDTFTQQLLQQLAQGAASQIGQKIGADEQTTNSALSAAIPLLVSALAKNASEPVGAQALHQAVANDHDGSILDNMESFLGSPEAANGAGILKHVLGGQQPVVTKGLTKNTGLNSNQVGQLLQIVAPLVMGMLGKQQKQAGLDANDLSGLLSSEKLKVEESNPDMMSTLNTLLDMNNDGSALDDILNLAGKLFGAKK